MDDMAQVREDLRRTVGDDWDWRWTTDADVSGWSDPVITIRRGPTPGEVLATSTGDSPTVTTDGTDFATGVLAWQVARDVTTEIEPGKATLEIEVLINGKAQTVMSEAMVIRPEVAVR